MIEGTGWQCVALSRDLPAGTVAGTRLGGREIALWRDEDGGAHAWEDRCPHRGMRLSFGFVRDGRLGCLYHGWSFDRAGICRAFPAHPEVAVPDSIAVPGYYFQFAIGPSGTPSITSTMLITQC